MAFLAGVVIVAVFLCWAVYFHSAVQYGQRSLRKNRIGKKRRLSRVD